MYVLCVCVDSLDYVAAGIAVLGENSPLGFAPIARDNGLFSAAGHHTVALLL